MLYKVKLTQIGNLAVIISNIVCIPERLNTNIYQQYFLNITQYNLCEFTELQHTFIR